MKEKDKCVFITQVHGYAMLAALRFVHVMYGAREMSGAPPCLTRVLRRASGSFAILFKSCIARSSRLARYVKPSISRLTARRFRIPGTICGHHLVSVFRNASSLLPLGFSHAVNSSTCE